MNYRKYISIFIALFILVVNSSATLVFHSCHDEIAYVSLGYHDSSLHDGTDENTCCIPVAEEIDKATDSCCSNQEIKIDKKVDYSLVDQLKIIFEASSFLINTNNFSLKITPTLKQEGIEYTYNSHAPPFYKLYSKFIFYA